jgi:hypothetical protein
MGRSAKAQAEHKPGWLERFAICNETNEDVVGMFIGLGILLVGSENWGMWRAIIAVATWRRLFI